MKTVSFLCIVCLLLGCARNRTDEHYRRQGRWKMYYDDERKQLMWKGKYRNHKQVGTWKYYKPDGSIYLKERYQKDLTTIRTTYFYPNGNKHLEGVAFFVETKDTAYYRWEGEWYKYDSAGVLNQISFYKFGKFAWFLPLPVKK